MENDISALLSAVADGNMDALGKLYDQISPRIFNYARTIAPESAEDITHDTFLQIYRHAERIAAKPNSVAYIMVITRNRAYDARKRCGNTVPLNDELAHGQAPPDVRMFLEEAFALLPAAQRETVHLHLVCGFTHKEVAKIQNAPLVTVKWRYGKALAQLKAYFNETEVQCNESL